jgi:hypothetical protein
MGKFNLWDKTELDSRPQNLELAASEQPSIGHWFDSNSPLGLCGVGLCFLRINPELAATPMTRIAATAILEIARRFMSLLS